MNEPEIATIFAPTTAALEVSVFLFVKILFLSDLVLRTTDSQQLAKKLVVNVANGFLTDSEFDIRVTKVAEYGIFAEIVDFPSQSVFVPVSELNSGKSAKANEITKVDEVIRVRGLGYERLGKPAFSKKRILEAPDSSEEGATTVAQKKKNPFSRK